MKPARKIARYIMLGLIGLFVTINHLTSSLVGVLALLLLIYFGVPLVSDIEFWGMRETFQWMAAQPPDSLLTVAGIIAAYAIAVATWRQQKVTELKHLVYNDIADFFQAAGDDLLTLELYSENLSDLHKRIMAGVSPAALESTAEHLMREMPAAIEARQRLMRTASDVHTLRGKYELLISQGPMIDKGFELGERALQDATGAMWIEIPVRADNPTNFLRILSISDTSKFAVFEAIVGKARPKMLATAGGLRGVAIGKLIRPTLWSLVRFRKTSLEIMKD